MALNTAYEQFIEMAKRVQSTTKTHGTVIEYEDDLENGDDDILVQGRDRIEDILLVGY